MSTSSSPRVPDNFGQLHHLDWLNNDLGADHHKPTISKLPDSFLKLSNLQRLRLKNFKDLEELPSSIMGLQKLRSLDLHGCPIQGLPYDSGRLPNLDSLDIDLGAIYHKPAISKLPDAFSKLSNLRYLNLTNFKGLQELPSSMMGLQKLHSLKLYGCPLRALPDDFGQLHNLEYLYIDLGTKHHKPTVSKLPDSFSKLSKLALLTLTNFKDL